MGKRKDITYWNIPVPKILNEAVEEAVLVDMHATKSDFVRDAVREKLKDMGFIATFQKQETKRRKKQELFKPMKIKGKDS